MRRLLWLLPMLLCASALAQTDLRPNVDGGTVAWATVGFGTGDCVDTTAEFGCVNSDVESPEDSTYVTTSTDTAAEIFGFTDAPGDYGTTNSVTGKVRAQCNGGCTNDDLDRIDVAFTTSGGSNTFTIAVNAGAGADCTVATAPSWSNCSFSLTTTLWDTSGEITSGTVTLTYTNNAVSMPDTTNYAVSEIEIVLDYNVAGARRRFVIGPA